MHRRSCRCCSDACGTEASASPATARCSACLLAGERLCYAPSQHGLDVAEPRGTAGAAARGAPKCGLPLLLGAHDVLRRSQRICRWGMRSGRPVEFDVNSAVGVSCAACNLVPGVQMCQSWQTADPVQTIDLSYKCNTTHGMQVSHAAHGGAQPAQEGWGHRTCGSVRFLSDN